MLHSSTSQSVQEKRWTMLLMGMVLIETLLVALALVPAQLWTRILANSPSAALDGPFPPTIAPVITVLLYIIPTAIGFFSRTWQRALLYATLPAWIGLGAFVAVSDSK